MSGRILENLINLDLKSLDEQVNAEARAIELDRENKDKRMKKLNDLAHLFNTRFY